MKRNKASAFDPGFSGSGLPAASRRMVWLLGLLTFGTAGMVLWIVSEAIRSEQLAARQRWNEAAQIRLTDARQRLESFFVSRRVALLQLADQAPPQIFAAAVRDGIADSLLCPANASADQQAYPQAFLPQPAVGLESHAPALEITNAIIPQDFEVRAREAETHSPALPRTEVAGAWLAAQRAWLNALTENANPEAAVEPSASVGSETSASIAAPAPGNAPDVSPSAPDADSAADVTGKSPIKPLPPELATALRIAEEFFSPPARRLLTGPDGRRLAAAADLRVLQEFHRLHRKLPHALTVRLRRELADYGSPALPAPQRRFLMAALTGLENEPPTSVFDTFAAETLAARYQLSPSAPDRITALSLSENGPVLLFETGNLRRILATLADSPGLQILTAADKGQLPDTVSGAGNTPAAATPPIASTAAGPTPSRGGATPEITPSDSRASAADSGTAVLDIHPALPGWRLAMACSSQDSGTRRIAFYVWTGGAFVVLLCILTLITWRQVQSHLRRARLRHDLAATVSHELRTPVASMRVLVDSLCEDPQLEETKTREYLTLLSSENHRLSQLIDNFLTLARLDRTGPLSTDPPIPISLQALFDRCATSGAAAGYRGRLRFGFPLSNPSHHSDPGTEIAAAPALLETALLNLIDNACKFSPPGSPVLCEAKFETDGSQQCVLRLSVHDEGPGLSPAEQKRIWQPFERLPLHHRTHRGCGLGLAIVQRAITLSGGRVEITSAPGKGSAFHILLPIPTPILQR